MTGAKVRVINRWLAPEIVDSARRAADIVNGYRSFLDWDELKNKWLAIRLSDGGYDGNLYDNKRDAVRHQSNEFLCAYLCYRNAGPGASPWQELAIFLQDNRDRYDHGQRLPDPDDVHGGPGPAMSTAMYEFYRGTMGALFTNEIVRQAKQQGIYDEILDQIIRGGRGA